MSVAETLTQTALRDEFADAVLEGLSKPAREVPCRFLYDGTGSGLFEAITRVEEYYPTRTEIALLEAYAADVHRLAGPGRAIVEFGSGSSRKIRILLDEMDDLAAYVPLEISSDALDEAVDRLDGSYPGLDIIPVHGDFLRPIALPDEIAGAPKLGFFPGSTIGNFSRDGARAFLANARDVLGAGSALLIGVDLQKSEDILVPAYNDAQGVTAAFTLNLLRRINRELAGTFDLDGFRHDAIYNRDLGRIEIYLVSRRDQTARVLGRAFHFTEGERIHTEYSHKYTVDGFGTLAGEAGWQRARTWVDDNNLFSLHYLTPARED